MQPVVVQQPMTTVSVVPHPQPPQPTICEHYAAKQALFLGVAQVIIGALCIILQIGAIVIDAYAALAVAGIYCGLAYVVCGVLAILSGRLRTRCMITGCMVTCVVTTVLFLLPLLVATSVGISHDNDDDHCNWGKEWWEERRLDCPPLEDKEAKIALNILLLVLVFVEFGALIWTSALGCSVLCCANTGARPGVIVASTTMPMHGQVQTVSAGQVLVVPSTGGAVVSTPMQQQQLQQQQFTPAQQLPAYTAQQQQQPPLNPAYSAPPPSYKQ